MQTSMFNGMRVSKIKKDTGILLYITQLIDVDLANTKRPVMFYSLRYLHWLYSAFLKYMLVGDFIIETLYKVIF